MFYKMYVIIFRCNLKRQYTFFCILKILFKFVVSESSDISYVCASCSICPLPWYNTIIQLSLDTWRLSSNWSQLEIRSIFNLDKQLNLGLIDLNVWRKCSPLLCVMIERLPSIDKLFSTVVFVVILPNVDLTLSAHIIIYYIVVIHTYKQEESLGECSTASSSVIVTKKTT